ncbi:hypothetical protein BDK51DRAFT_44450 [Blyttiomyces helicus]|uniref:Uncharacterized protein n=1 Tax=Blyttiomyces helicus TaxID=388810 RepID=A0A4V1IRI1_9FUNG|nr:hypothetical protein BDK51DRAFT_44450 [Blyttiomyces helicus]|eukprot:RKO90137.1 hypothetical protein BDK51DRAFT_44450 [Blyttiomyces helicus]
MDSGTTATKNASLPVSINNSPQQHHSLPPHRRRLSAANPLSYDPSLLDVYNFYSTSRPRRPSFSGTVTLAGMDIITTSANPGGGFHLNDDLRHDAVHSLENSFCKDFECCGTNLGSLHELLQHYEETHVRFRPGVSVAAPYPAGSRLPAVSEEPEEAAIAERSPPLRHSDSASDSPSLSARHSSVPPMTAAASPDLSPSSSPDAIPSPALSHASLPASGSHYPADMDLVRHGQEDLAVATRGVSGIQEGMQLLHIEQMQMQQRQQGYGTADGDGADRDAGYRGSLHVKRPRAPSISPGEADEKKLRAHLELEPHVMHTYDHNGAGAASHIGHGGSHMPPAAERHLTRSESLPMYMSMMGGYEDPNAHIHQPRANTMDVLSMMNSPAPPPALLPAPPPHANATTTPLAPHAARDAHIKSRVVPRNPCDPTGRLLAAAAGVVPDVGPGAPKPPLKPADPPRAALLPQHAAPAHVAATPRAAAAHPRPRRALDVAASAAPPPPALVPRLPLIDTDARPFGAVWDGGCWATAAAFEHSADAWGRDVCELPDSAGG